jgi:hypothetical protein
LLSQAIKDAQIRKIRDEAGLNKKGDPYFKNNQNKKV